MNRISGVIPSFKRAGVSYHNLGHSKDLGFKPKDHQGLEVTYVQSKSTILSPGFRIVHFNSTHWFLWSRICRPQSSESSNSSVSALWHQAASVTGIGSNAYVERTCIGGFRHYLLYHEVGLRLPVYKRPRVWSTIDDDFDNGFEGFRDHLVFSVVKSCSAVNKEMGFGWNEKILLRWVRKSLLAGARYAVKKH
jgi:hypothetical protein